MNKLPCVVRMLSLVIFLVQICACSNQLIVEVINRPTATDELRATVRSRADGTLLNPDKTLFNPSSNRMFVSLQERDHEELDIAVGAYNGDCLIAKGTASVRTSWRETVISVSLEEHKKPECPIVVQMSGVLPGSALNSDPKTSFVCDGATPDPLHPITCAEPQPASGHQHCCVAYMAIDQEHALKFDKDITSLPSHVVVAHPASCAGEHGVCTITPTRNQARDQKVNRVIVQAWNNTLSTNHNILGMWRSAEETPANPLTTRPKPVYVLNYPWERIFVVGELKESDPPNGPTYKGFVAELDLAGELTVVHRTKHPLRAITGFNGDDVWAIGDGGTVLHRSQDGWKETERSIDDTVNLRSMWADQNRREVWIVGYNGDSLTAAIFRITGDGVNHDEINNVLGPYNMEGFKIYGDNASISGYRDASGKTMVFSGFMPSNTTDLTIRFDGEKYLRDSNDVIRVNAVICNFGRDTLHLAGNHICDKEGNQLFRFSSLYERLMLQCTDDGIVYLIHGHNKETILTRLIIREGYRSNDIKIQSDSISKIWITEKWPWNSINLLSGDCGNIEINSR